MLNRNIPLVVCLCLASAVAFAQGNQGTGYVFELPSPDVSGTHFQGYIYNSTHATPDIDVNGPAGVTQIIPKPDGSKFYLLSNAGLVSADPTFTIFKNVNAVSGIPTAGAFTPDGKYFLAGATGLVILDASNDSAITSPVTITGTIVGFTFSQDSRLAYVLSNSAFGSSVTVINLASRTEVGQPFNLPFGGATSIGLSPVGLIYVGAINRVYEIDPSTMQITSGGEIAIFASPGPLRFTPDGSTAYFVNTTSNSGGSAIFKLDIASRKISTWPPVNSGFGAPVFDDVEVASNNRIFAHTKADTTLWDVTPSPFSVQPADTAPGGTSPTGSLYGVIPATNVISFALSNELPSARFLYTLNGNSQQAYLNRIDLSTNTTTLNVLSTLGPGVLDFASIPPQTGASQFLQFNQSQTLPPSATSAPLIAYVLDATGRPVYNLPVTFSADTSTGLVINGAAQTTNANGFVQTTVTLPAAPGTYNVTLTVGTATAAYSLTIAGSGGGGPGPSNQVSIVTGNGEFLPAGVKSPDTAPLTIKVVDANGAPLANVAVKFTIVSGPVGVLDNPNTVTDANGLASTGYTFGTPDATLPSQAADINASTPFGSVDFTETSWNYNSDLQSGTPDIELTNPAGRIITGGEGDVISNAITATIQTTALTGQSLPVPGVGIRIGNSPDDGSAGPASCQGSALSDNTGTANCNLVISCKIGVTSVPMNVFVGELKYFPVQLVVGAGSSRNVNIESGNNQIGRVGTQLPYALVATIADNCGTPISGVQVTWKVTQGSATLSNQVNVSDSAGHISTRVTLGQTAGTIKITASIGNTDVHAEFTLTSQVVVNGLSLVSGGSQTTVTGTAFAQPVVFQVVDVNSNPVPNLQVKFSIAGVSATVNPASATTDSQGHVSTTVTAGLNPGTVTVTAAYATFSANATLTVRTPGPAITSSNFYNAASFQQGLVPCGLATVIGTGLAPDINGVVLGSPLGIGALPYSIPQTNGTSITINTIPAPIQSVVNMNGIEQVTFQTPCEVVPGPATVNVTVKGVTTTVTGVQVLAVQPGIFVSAGPNKITYGAVIRAADGTYVTPDNFAHRGETYYMVVTGLGQTSPNQIQTNAAGTGSQTIPIFAPDGTQQVIVGVNNAGVPVVSAQYVAGTVGVYIVGFQIPEDAPTGPNQPLAVQIQGIFGNPTYLPGVQ